MKKKKATHLAVYIVLLVAVGAVGIACGYFDSIGNVFSSINLRLDSILRIVVMALTVLAIAELAIMILGLFRPTSHRTSTVISLTQSFIQYASVIIIICWALTLLGVNMTAVAASVGVVTLVLGFSAESLIADMITGIFLLFEGQYNVGDIVEVNGFRGTVRSIGIRSTAIEDTGGNVRVVSNSDMKNLLNRSHNGSLAVCNIGIPYETDLEKFELQIPAIVQDIYNRHRDMFLRVPEYRGVDELGSSAVILLFTAEVNEADIYNSSRILNHDLLIAFRHAGVEVPYDQLDVHTK